MLAVECALGRKKLQCDSYSNEEMSDTGEKDAGKKMEEKNSRKDANNLPRASWRALDVLKGSIQ
jgi:hypothetical protein